MVLNNGEFSQDVQKLSKSSTEVKQLSPKRDRLHDGVKLFHSEDLGKSDLQTCRGWLQSRAILGSPQHGKKSSGPQQTDNLTT